MIDTFCAMGWQGENPAKILPADIGENVQTNIDGDRGQTQYA
ncbi:MAG: hypothetical protein WA970_00030 [Gammaproteobacteria bacterium]